MDKIKDYALKALIALLPTLSSLVSDTFRKALEDGVRTFYARVLATDNKYDDVVGKMIADLLNIDISDVSAE